MPPPVTPLVLTTDDRSELSHLPRYGLARLTERALIVLACADRTAGDNSNVAADLGLATEAVGRWRRWFIERGLAGLADNIRPGWPKTTLIRTGPERDQFIR